MKGTMTIIPPAGPEVRVELDGAPQLEAMHKAIDGYLEQVPAFHSLATDAGVVRCVALCNEDGKGLGLPFNSRANLLWCAALKRDHGVETPAPDYLVGTVIVLTGDREFMESL